MWATALLCALLVLSVGGQTPPEAESSATGFLADEVPLEIVTTTPTALTRRRNVAVQGQQAITVPPRFRPFCAKSWRQVVFSRPVIALGSDFGFEELPPELVPFTLDPAVPGRGRWVTTFIYRFDTDGPFATDLRLTFAWNLQLRTYDGVPLTLESAETVTLTTPVLSMDIVDVRSALANNATEDNWNPNTGLNDDILPEVPPDGVIELSFDAPVSLSVLQEELKVVEMSGETMTDIGVVVEPCLKRKAPVDGEAQCANVTLDGDLQMGTEYALFLGAGVDYGNASGPLSKDLRETFGGLRRFVIPFIDDFRPTVSTPFLDLYIPHGLAEGTDVNDIPITLMLRNDEPLPFNLTQVSKSILRLIADLKPSLPYTISVGASNDVKDGFGLTLEASSLRFRTGRVFPSVEQVSSGNFPPYAVFEASQDWGRQLLAFSKGMGNNGVCPSGSVIDIWGVDDVASAFPIFLGSSRMSFQRFLGTPDDVFVINRTSGAVLSTRDISPFLSGSGAVAYQLCRFGSFRPELFLETNVQVVVLSNDQSTSDQEVTVWVTSMETGEPVAEATVSIYGDNRQPTGNPTLMGSGVTNADGLARVQGVTDRGINTAVVQMGSKFVYVPDVSLGSRQRSRVKSSIVLDRALVRPGEILHVKGYVFERDDKEFVPAEGLVNTVLVVSPPIQGNETFPVTLNNEFGSFEAEIDIPDEAALLVHSLSFRAMRGGNNIRGSFQSFTVGDPRLPTVDLTVDTPFFVRPADEIEIQVNVESFIGSAVGGSEITVKWELADFRRDDEEEPVEGELTIVTDDTGNGTATIDLSELEVPPSIGSTISIDFQFVGPTSELIEESAEVRIEAADVSLTLVRTVDTDIPEQIFGVAVEITDLQGNPLAGKNKIETATVSLVELPEDSDFPDTSDSPLDGTIIESCEIAADGEEYCDLALPAVGDFAIEGCVTQGDATICERIFLGRTQESWEDNPLSSFLPIGFTDLSPDELELGSKKEILVENPYSDAQALVSWGTLEAVREFVMPIPSGRSKVVVDVDETCEFDCGLSIVMAVPRQTEGLAADVPIPVSKLFDAALPHTRSFTGGINVRPTDPTKLEVNITFPEAVEDEGTPVVGPGDNTTIEVEINTEEDTEVTLIAVDKAVLDLLPYPLVDISAEFIVNLTTFFRSSSLNEFITTPLALQALIETFNSRSALDPWFSISSRFVDRFRVDQSEEEYIEQESEFITIRFFGRRFRRIELVGSGSSAQADQGFAVASAQTVSVSPGGPLPVESPAVAVARSAAPGDLSAEAEAQTGGAELDVRLESDFVSTALFETDIAENGNLKATFTAPSNLGTFVVRAYVASRNGIFGSAESEIIVRRELSLTPSIPRFARVGDVFEAGAVVTVSGSTSAPVTLSAEIDGPLEFLGENVLSVEVGADGQEEARFLLKASAVGTANITLIADDGLGNTDALQLEIEIEGLQEAVTVGTSFTVEGEDTQSFVEGIDLPEAVPGSGEILITAGVGRQPSVFALSDQILNVKDPFECPVDGDFGLAAATIPGIVNPYDPWNPTAGTVDEELITLIELILEDFDPAVDLLVPGGGLTSQAEGFRSFLPCPRNDFDRDPSFFQNAKGVFLLNQVEAQLVNHGVPEVQARTGDLLRARDLWVSVLSSEFERLAVERREDTNPSALSTSTVAFGRAALGPSWQPDTNNATIIDDLSMDRLSSAFEDLSTQSQAYYILARLSEPNGQAHPDVDVARQMWTDLLRITGRTAYISASPGATAPASDLTNSLVFLALQRAGDEGQLLPRLGNYIASPVADNFGFRIFGIYEKLVTMQALVEFDVSRGSAQPDLEFEAVSGNFSLLTASFTNASAPIATARIPWDDLPEEPMPIEVSAVGEGEASVTISLNFVPAELLPFPTYRGIFVERSIQSEDAEEGDGPGLSVVPRGSVVSVKVQFLTPDALGETVVRVFMPAGLEPVDPNISGEGNFCPVPFSSFFRSFFFRCPAQETRPEVVTFTFDRVRPGTTSVSFRAVAATTGNYTLPPTRVFASDQPEVMGLSSAGTFEVCSGPDCDFAFLEPAVAPKTCPGDCSGSGACNLRDGVCLCFSGFSGDACELLLEA